MRTITLWASRHQMASRLFIAAAHVILAVIAMELAGCLQLLTVDIPLLFFGAGIAICLLLAAAFHAVKKHWRISVRTAQGYYLVRLKYAFVLVATYLMVTAWFYGEFHTRYAGGTPLFGSLVSSTSSNVVATNAGTSGKHQRKQMKASFKELKQALREVKKSRSPESEKSAAIFGILLLASALSLVVLAVSCNLSCAGTGTGAVLVGVLGMGLIIWGTVAWIKHVNKKYKQKIDSKQQPAAANAETR